MLLPIFAPNRIAELEPSTRAYCHELIEGMQGRDTVDAAVEYAQHIPVRVIARMLGLPPDDLGRLRRWSDDFATLFGSDPSAVTSAQYARARESALEMTDYFLALAAERRARPQDDLLTLIAHGEIDGQPVTVTR